ncbi:MAG: hypothetical protein AAF604_13540 [Acidobacteriota bacterium]
MPVVWRPALPLFVVLILIITGCQSSTIPTADVPDSWRVRPNRNDDSPPIVTIAPLNLRAPQTLRDGSLAPPPLDPVGPDNPIHRYVFDHPEGGGDDTVQVMAIAHDPESGTARLTITAQLRLSCGNSQPQQDPRGLSCHDSGAGKLCIGRIEVTQLRAASVDINLGSTLRIDDLADVQCPLGGELLIQGLLTASASNFAGQTSLPAFYRFCGSKRRPGVDRIHDRDLEQRCGSS